MRFPWQRPNPIIIGGFYRSGTTLLRRLIDAHSQIYCGAEVKFWRDLYSDYKDDPYTHIRFFTTARSTGLSDQMIKNIFGNAYISLLNHSMEMKGKKRWADKNPENLLYLNEWHDLLKGKMQFVFLVRNPLDTLASLKEAAFDKTLPIEFDGKVDMFVNYLLNGIDFLQQYPQKSYLLRYEDLVLSPKNSLKALMTWLGHTYEGNVLNDFWRPERGTGIEDPKIAAATSIHDKSLNRWQKELSIYEIELARKKLLPYFQTLGYENF